MWHSEGGVVDIGMLKKKVGKCWQYSVLEAI